MDLVGLKKDEELIDEFIEATETDTPLLRAFWNMFKQLFWPLTWKGIFNGFGYFFGTVYCSYYILPKLGLKEFAPYK